MGLDDDVDDSENSEDDSDVEKDRNGRVTVDDVGDVCLSQEILSDLARLEYAALDDIRWCDMAGFNSRRVDNALV